MRKFKEYFEYTPGVLRAFVRPAHLDSLTFTLQPVYERKMGDWSEWGSFVVNRIPGRVIRNMMLNFRCEVHLGRSEGAERRSQDGHRQDHVLQQYG